MFNFPGRSYSWNAALERGVKGVPVKKKKGHQTLQEVVNAEKTARERKTAEQIRHSLLKQYEVRFSRSYLDGAIRDSGTEIVEATTPEEATAQVDGAYSVRLVSEEKIEHWYERNREFF